MQADIDTKNMQKSIFLCDHEDSVCSGEPDITVAPEFPSLQQDFHFMSFDNKHFLNKSVFRIWSFHSAGSSCVAFHSPRKSEFRAKVDAYIGVVSIVSCQEPTVPQYEMAHA